MVLLALIASAVVAHGAGQASTAFPRLQRLDGAETESPSSSAATILLFWRSDCAPCLLELSDLAALRASAPNIRIVPVSLGPVAPLSPALARLGLDANDTLRAAEDPARLLARLGGAPPRLPLSVAFRKGGEFCGRHSGLVGRDQVRAWALECSDVHAGR